MPIYDYVCSNCGQRTEVMHAVDAPGLEECPVCGGFTRKAVSAPAVVFKGSGWAKKDARSATRNSSNPEKDKASDVSVSEAGGAPATKEAMGSSSD